jgi:hypothetical protein
VCHRGARRRGQATFLPARSSEDMDAAFGRPMLTTAHASSPHSSEAKMRPSMCRGVRASLIEPRRPTLSAPGCSLSPPAFCSRTPAPAGVEPCSSCPSGARMFTRTHVLASELPRRRGHPSRDAAELEPHQAVYLRTVVLVREQTHARAGARPSCRLCSPCSSPVNTFARESRT